MVQGPRFQEFQVLYPAKPTKDDVVGVVLMWV